MNKYVKIVGSDGFDTILFNGEIAFVGPSLSVSAWVENNGIFVSDVIGD